MTIQKLAAFKFTCLGMALALAGCGGGGGETESASAASEGQSLAVPTGEALTDVSQTALPNVAAAFDPAPATDPSATAFVPTVDDGTVSAAAAPKAASTGNPADATVAGAITTPYPALYGMSVEWAFTGDANANAIVSARYRPQGQADWYNAMPLRRVKAGSSSGFSWATRHSGSIFNLNPGVSYDVELTLKDPDGGSVTRTTTVATRPIPAAMAHAPVKNATPSNIASVLASAQAGDVIQLGGGNYGTLTIEKDGAAGRPLVIRGTPGAVITGEVLMRSRNHVSLEALTVNGRIRFNGSNNVSITRCTVNASASMNNEGIVTHLRSENAHIADNVVTGPVQWAVSSLGVSGNNGNDGILVTGPGHSIVNNRVSGFRDNISLLEESEAVDQFSIEILNNDLSFAADDAIESDYCYHNCRVMNNRITNAFVGVSSQPSLGGPTYMVRNSLYNIVFNAFKLNNNSYGNVLLHNTVVKSGDALGIYADAVVGDLFTRNNLFIGGPGVTTAGYSSGLGKVMSVLDLQVATADMNYDAMGSMLGTFNGRFGSTAFNSMADMRNLTTEKNGVQADMAVFLSNVTLPTAPMTAYTIPDLRVRSGAAVEDAGAILPNITDGFIGRAPDLGAYEAGSALRVVGPRP